MGHERGAFPRDDEPVGAPGHTLPALPATVAAAHLAACAGELADGTAPGVDVSSVADLGDLADVVADLVTGQRQIAAALAQLAGRLADRRGPGPLADACAPDLTALGEVLSAAACASGHAAGALSASAPVFDAVLEIAGRDTPLR